MTRALLGAALIALAAAPAYAQSYETRTYYMDPSRTYGSPGNQYEIIGPNNRKVTVIEGQPRWASQERTVVEDRRGAYYYSNVPPYLPY